MGLRRNLIALRDPGALEELAERGVPDVWRRSIATLLSVIDDLGRQLARSSANCDHSPAPTSAPGC